MRWVGHVASIGVICSRTNLIRKPEGKRKLGRYMCRWEDNIKIDLKGTQCESVDWNQGIQNRVLWCALELGNEGKGGKCLDWLSGFILPRRTLLNGVSYSCCCYYDYYCALL
jgi:hypothetical protein